ncbi:MAG: radical SAM family heme chaperone HemW [Eubacteriales bacterium]|nr:radical SAM family heme chaperone HemW [Eubacteriales bacterium]
MLSLYLHFPFCIRKCAYCDFCSAPAGEAEIAAYCSALQTEIELTARLYGDLSVDTVYLGGGTPSTVPADLMGAVLATLRERFLIVPGAEFTSESNPGTLSEAWLHTLLAAGANRLSLGVQAKQARLLSILGRIHDFDQALDAFALARRAGFTNLSADAMFGLPTQTAQEYLATLDALAEAGMQHISAYSLILEEGTPLFARVKAGELTPPGEDETADMMEWGVDRLEALGFQRYEISNFAKPGFQCLHNLGYWQQKQYLGLGASAASLLPAPQNREDTAYVRRTNTADVGAYVTALSQGRLPPAETTPVPMLEAMFETVMLGLRTVQGVRYADFARRYGREPGDIYGPAIETLTRQGLLQPARGEDPRLALTRRGLMLQNTALMAFMEP